VVQTWPGLIVCKLVTVCPGHIWTTLYKHTILFCPLPLVFLRSLSEKWFHDRSIFITWLTLQNFLQQISRVQQIPYLVMYIILHYSIYMICFTAHTTATLRLFILSSAARSIDVTDVSEKQLSLSLKTPFINLYWCDWRFGKTAFTILKNAIYK
jgi:hypothetical protein